MGCDIHTNVEVRRNGAWERVGPVFPSPWADQDWADADDKADTDEPFRRRSYALFARLAGVRNYEGVTPVSEPRGLPDDMTTETRANADDWRHDGHSHSWLTLAELQQIDPDCGEFRLEDFARDVAVMATLGEPEDVRVVFWFDN